MTNQKCPCIDCVCIPICRHRSFSEMLTRCSIIHEYENSHMERNGEEYFISLLELEKVLKPTNWCYKGKFDE